MQWASLKVSEKNYIDMLNDVLPETAARIERDSKRVNERLGVVTVRLTASLKKKKTDPVQKSREMIF